MADNAPFHEAVAESGRFRHANSQDFWSVGLAGPRTLGPVLIHSVYFWFKADADPERVSAFEAGLRRLTSIDQIQQAYFGKPERTPERPVIDQSYQWALVVHFDSLADHDVYQEHALHREFLDRFAATWARVQVYDVHV